MISRNAKLKKKNGAKHRLGKKELVLVGTLKKLSYQSCSGTRLIFGWYEAKYSICYQDWHKMGTRSVFIPQVLATKLI